jgi:hypothetical protein
VAMIVPFAVFVTEPSLLRTIPPAPEIEPEFLTLLFRPARLTPYPDAEEILPAFEIAHAVLELASMASAIAAVAATPPLALMVTGLLLGTRDSVPLMVVLIVRLTDGLPLSGSR